MELDDRLRDLLFPTAMRPDFFDKPTVRFVQWARSAGVTWPEFCEAAKRFFGNEGCAAIRVEQYMEHLERVFRSALR